MARRRRARRCACRRGWNEREPERRRPHGREAEAREEQERNDVTARGGARPAEDVAATSPAGAATGARTSLGRRRRAAPYARIDGASLLLRVFLEDVLACPCGGRRRILRDVTAPTAVVALWSTWVCRHARHPRSRAEPSWFDAA